MNLKVKMICFLIVLLGNGICLFAQDQTVKELQKATAKKGSEKQVDSGQVWKTGGVFNLNVGQGSQSNWAAGGDDFTFSLGSYLGYYALYKKGRYSWDNTVDLNYGIVNTTSQGTRKNDDRMDFLSKLGYELNPKLSLAGLINFHSQFSKGYRYNKDGSKALLSDFIAPGYLLISLGLDYKPAEGLSIFVSPITSRWTFVQNDFLSSEGAYGVSPGKKVRNEIGAFASIQYMKNLNEIIHYKGRLDLFSNYANNPQNVDVMMNNMFTAKLSKILSASLGLDLIYDDDVKLFGPDKDSPGLQLKQIMTAGISVNF
ncbi:MAG: DUF3078 domain-containing protein [Ginsengibacter sp.]